MTTTDKYAILEKTKRNFRWSYIFTALVLIILGLVLLIHPTIARNLLCYLVGAVLTVYGGFNIISFLCAKDRRLSFDLFIGIVTAAVGLFTLISPSSVFHIIQTILGLIIVVDSALNIKRALSIREMAGKGWLVLLIASAVATILGILLIVQRDIFGQALFTVIGILLVYQGLSDLVSLLGLNFLGKRRFKQLDAAADTDDTLDAD